MFVEEPKASVPVSVADVVDLSRSFDPMPPESVEPKVPKKKREPRTAKPPKEAKIDKDGKPLLIGQGVVWHGRCCVVLRFDRDFPSLVEIDDPEASQRWMGAKKTERIVRCDELEEL